ncbi:ATP-binding protein [Sulfurifustis variabilis]|uniref:ATP-binding protein n=1 Tax=Sulfurifustis variabilis TaxID=1675686 RepID=A0A1B4V0R5_9GAMM|nr:helicase HerA-like domain-containing protein [Sulfurifustis variabilis]BAU47048.1 ATP-binding protein [Sulfurifustis variabilis]
MAEPLFIGKGRQALHLLPALANRHGLIAGATGTGKTVSLQVLAEGFSRAGVPVFLADVKGDLAGLSQPGSESAKLKERLARLDIEFAPEACPVRFWDVYGELGHPARTTISEMGPLLLGRLLNLNETQEGVLTALFRIADDNGWLLLDLKDLRAMVQFAGDNAKTFTTQYGNISAASIGAIQRALLALESQGAERLFGEPALALDDLIQTEDGRGVVNILAAEKLMQSPKVYATFLLWLLAELFEQLPEVGDREKPRLVFFFDEAHLLFEDAPKALLDKIEQVVRLIRSKGVGVYFVTQSPLDVPQDVLGQLGNRIQHALRAFTPRDQKAVRAAAETFRPNPGLDVSQAITELGVGEALVSLLDEAGSPAMVERALIAPPRSRIGPITTEERRRLIDSSPLRGHYERAADRESAYEILKRRAETPPEQTTSGSRWDELLGGGAAKGGRRREGMAEAMMKSASRAIGSQIGRQIIRGVLGSLLGGKR